MMSYQPKIALVHDDFMQSGGAEKLFAQIASIYPDAPIYTSLVNWNKLPSSIDKARVRSSFAQKIPFAKYFYKALLPLYPLAFESFNFSKYDLVISSSTRFAKSIITNPKTVHIAYLNSVPRFIYKEAQQNYLPSFLRKVLTPYFKWLKRWDRSASSRADFYIANSQNVKSDVAKIYKKEAEVVYPFADTDFFKPAKIHKWNLKSQKYFLVTTRLVKWKKVDIAIESAANLGVNLKIVGEGPDKTSLKKLCARHESLNNKRTEFLGSVTREELRDLYQNCQALIVTQEEDFGVSTAEAQACGKPVVAYSRGGQKEIIIDGKTGLFFENQLAQSVEHAISRFYKLKWSESLIRQNAMRFSKNKFKESFIKTIKLYAS